MVIADCTSYEPAQQQLTVAISNLNGEGMEQIVEVVEEALADLFIPIEGEIPYSLTPTGKS